MTRANTAGDFWKHAHVAANGCILWTGAGSEGRYGKFRQGPKKVAAHRYAWELFNGDVPAGMCVCHRCDAPRCVNPAHLFLGTHLENMQDRDAKGRHNAAKGAAQGTAKLTDDQVRAIRFEYAAGARQIDLAAKYGVYQTTISKIVLRVSWTHIQ